MKLNNETLKNRAEWEAKGYRLPEYDREAMIARTKENPHLAALRRGQHLQGPARHGRPAAPERGRAG